MAITPAPTLTAVVSDDVSRPSGHARFQTLRQGAPAGRFVVLKLLGEGAMGAVFKAYDPQLRREVALKVLHSSAPAGIARPTDHGDDASLVREAQTMARLVHPNVVSVYDVALVGQHVVIAMEYLAGETLRAWLARRSRGWQEIVTKFIAAGEGLAAAHRASIVHRDFKPANVLVAEDGRVKVADFGISHAGALLDPSQDEEQHELQAIISGTPRYMSPEQHEGLAIDPRSDQFSFCVALWEAICQQPPFTEASERALAAAKHRGPPRWPREIQIPAQLVATVRRGLQVAPEHRFSSMEELLRELASTVATPTRTHLIRLSVPTVVLAATGTWISHQDRAEICAGVEQQLAGTWDAARKARVEAAFDASGLRYAADAWARTGAKLDGYADAWRAQYRDACEATAVHGEQSSEALDLRMACLHRARRELASSIDVLAEADAGVVEHALDVVARLPDPARCADVSALRDGAPPPPMSSERARVERAQRSLSHADALEAAGKYDAAQAHLQDARAIAVGVQYEPLAAELDFLTAVLAAREGDYPAAARDFGRALELAVALGLESLASNAASQAAHLLGVKDGRPDDAVTLARVAVAFAAQEGRSGPEVSSRIILGSVLDELRQHEAARAEFLHAIERAEQDPDDEPDLGGAVAGLASALAGLGDLEAAETQERRALEIQQQTWGPAHPRTAEFHNNLGLTLMQRGRLEEAEAELERAIAIWESAAVLDTPYIAAAYNNLGLVLAEQKRHAEAEVALRRALAVVTTLWGPEYPRTLQVRLLVAEVMAAQRNDAAELELRAVLRDIERVIGSEHAVTAAAHHRLGLVLLAAGRGEQARAHLERSWKIRATLDHRPHDRAATAFALGQMLWTHERSRARELLRAAEQDFERAGEAWQDEAEAVRRWLRDRQ